MADPIPPDEILEPGGEARPARPEPQWWREALILLPNLIKLLGRLIRDQRVPRRTRAFAMVVVAYLASPIDLIPDAIPVIGQTDDVLLALLALHYLINEVGDEIVLEHWDGHADLLEMVRTVVDWGSGLVPWPVRRAARRLLGA